MIKKDNYVKRIFSKQKQIKLFNFPAIFIQFFVSAVIHLYLCICSCHQLGFWNLDEARIFQSFFKRRPWNHRWSHNVPNLYKQRNAESEIWFIEIPKNPINVKTQKPYPNSNLYAKSCNLFAKVWIKFYIIFI